MPPPRPELENPPEIYYNAEEAKRYTVSTRVLAIQRFMTSRALELLNLPAGSHGSLLLDIGCGSGISGDVLTESGYTWMGVDISGDMLRLAKEAELRRCGLSEVKEAPTSFSGSQTRVDTSHVRWGLAPSESEEEEEEEEEEIRASVPAGPPMVEVVQGDIGCGLPFRPGSFDGCVSISAIQWLCHSTRKGEVPQRRLGALFQSLYNALRRGAKAVIQFYPSCPEQVHMITRAAMKCGFSGGVVVDFPHSSRAKKHYLVLQAGQVAGGFVPPVALGEDDLASEGEEGEEMEEGEEEEDEEEEEERDRVRVGGRVAGAKRGRQSNNYSREGKRRRKDNRPVTGTRDWVLLKKEERRRRGLETSEDSKYTLRRRRPKF